jgi:hypothetical protein
LTRFRLAYLVSHPIQYQAPLLRFLSAQPELDLQVLFLSDMSVRGYHDPGFGVAVKWDVPLLDGYPHRFLPPAWGRDRLGFASPYPRGLASALDQGFDALWIHGYAHLANLSAIAIAKRLGLRVLLRGESHALSHPRSGFRRAIKASLMPALFSRIDAFLSIGRANRDYYRAYGVPAERIFPMPYAVDNDFFRQSAERARPNREAPRSPSREPGTFARPAHHSVRRQVSAAQATTGSLGGLRQPVAGWKARTPSLPGDDRRWRVEGRG